MAKQRVVLIVDDEPDNLAEIVEILESNEPQYELLQAFDGEKALEITRERKPDLVVTDWEMPGMDGLDLIKTIKSDSLISDIPVIMYTGVMTSSQNLEAALQAGAADYIRKPIDVIELRARVRSMLELSDSYKEIKDLQAHKDKIYAIIAHDLRGSIGSVKTLIEFLLEEDFSQDPETLRTMLQNTETSISNSYSLLENLLVWAQNELGTIDLEQDSLNLKEMVEANFSLYQEQARPKGIQLTNKVSDNVYVYADRNTVMAIIRNLISNAIKFNDQGGTVTVEANQKENMVEVYFSDTGTGIKEEKLKGIFNTNHSKAEAGNMSKKGTGLGLRICNEFVHRNGGTIDAESEVGKGTTFYVKLPAG